MQKDLPGLFAAETAGTAPTCGDPEDEVAAATEM